MKLDEKYIQKYAQSLESKIIQHVTADLQQDAKTKVVSYKENTRWSLKKAHDYMVVTVETLFGSDKHSGIVQFLLEDQAHLKYTVDEAVGKAEKLLERGWSIKEKRGRYVLLDESYATVKDVSGPTNIAPAEILLEEFGLENIFNFLTEPDLKSLLAVASKLNIPLENVKSPEFTYDMVVKHEGPNSKIFPLAQSYKSMGEILRKTYYFENEEGVETENMFDLYDQGYRIKPVLNPSDYVKSFLQHGGKSYAVVPVTGEKLGTESSDLLTHQFYTHVQGTFDSVNVESPLLIGELGQTYAYLLERNSELVNNQDYGEVIRLLNSMKSQNASKNYPRYTDILREVIQLYLINVLGIGNKGFNLSLLGIDHVQPKVTLRFSVIPALEDEKVLEKFFLNAAQQSPTEKDALVVIVKGMGFDNNLTDNFKTLLPYLDKEFVSNLRSFKGSETLSKRLNRFADFLEEIV